jgi:hypothetical protein
VNGHEYGKRAATAAGIGVHALDNGFTALDNGFAALDDPGDLPRSPRICDRLTPGKIDALLRTWLRILPHPHTPADRPATGTTSRSRERSSPRPRCWTGLRADPVSNRSSGRTSTWAAPTRSGSSSTGGSAPAASTRPRAGFRTRVLTQGVTPSPHVDYKHSKIKQYHKEGRALRTETTINDSRDFGIGKRLRDLPALTQAGFSANRHLLDVERLTSDPSIGEGAFRAVADPIVVGTQRASACRSTPPAPRPSCRL